MVEKIVKDFLVDGDAVNLIDVKAGVEHFGRKIPEHVDIILDVVDCTRESVSIARRMDQFCKEMRIGHFWLILNKIASEKLEASLRTQLGDLEHKVIGVIHHDQDIMTTALAGDALGSCRAREEAMTIVDRLEEAIAT